MKKVLCAAALAAIVAPAVNANAITVYEKDGFKYTLQNDWEIQLRQDVGQDQDLDMVFDDLELKNGAEYDLGNGVTVFGQLDFGFKKAGNNSNSGDRAHLEEAYLGFAAGDTSIKFGKTDGAADHFGVADAKENPVGDDAFDMFGATGGDDLIVVETKIADAVTLVADYEIAADSGDTDGNGKFFSIYGEAEVAGFTLGAAFQNYDPAAEEISMVATNGDEIAAIPVLTTVDPEDYNMYGVSLSYDAGFVCIGADWSIQEESDEVSEHTVTNIFLGAPLGDYVSVGAGYVMLDSDDDGDVNGWYANVAYTLPMQKNVSVFAEVEDNDEDESDMGFLVGMKLAF